MTERNPRNPPPTQATAVAAVDDTDKSLILLKVALNLHTECQESGGFLGT